MKRIIAFILLALLTTQARAAPPLCWPDVSLPITLSMASANQAPKVGEVIYAASAVGLVWGYTCIAPDGKWSKVIAGGPWTSFPAEWLYILDTLIRGTDADRAAAWTKYATASAWDARLQPDLDKVWALLPVQPVAPPPSTTGWAVAPTSVCSTADKGADGKCLRRGTYVWSGSARGALAAEKVDVGAACNPAVGSAGYYGLLGRNDRVAPCVKK